jgi:hypothetical protein
MKSMLYLKWLFKNILFLIAVLVLSGCGSDSKDSDTQVLAITPDFLFISSDKQSIVPGSNQSIIITAKSSSGENISGVVISLTLDNPSLASITSTVTTGADGTGTAIFTAGSNLGSVGITATSQVTNSDNTTTGLTSEKFTIEISSSSPPASMTLSANPTEIIATKASAISATIKDEAGNLVDSTAVTFSVTNTALGSFDGESSTVAYTNAGVATTTFIASQNTGTIEITVQAANIAEKILVTINPADASAITFNEVSVNPVAVKGTGGAEISTITFDVFDINGNPADDVLVTFKVQKGLDGGEFIEEDDTSPREHVVSAVNGKAKVMFHSGFVAGPVTIQASITTPAGGVVTAYTPVISIGGGVPTDNWLVFAPATFNIPGWEHQNLKTTATLLLADRFGNYNILDGHAVSFEAEIGMAVFSSTVSANKAGEATAQIRTNGSSIGVPCQDVAILPWETELKTDIANRYGITHPGHPRDGRCTIMAFTKGEESFADGSNGGTANGIYEFGESFIETIADPFRDYDGDGLYDGGYGADPFEDYVDVDNNGVWDGKKSQSQAVWEGDKYLFRNAEIIISGPPAGIPYYITHHYQDAQGDTQSIIDPAYTKSYLLEQEGNDQNGDGFIYTSATVHILICDANYNPLPGESSFRANLEEGRIHGSSNFTFFNSPLQDSAAGQLNLIEHTIEIADSDSSDTKPPKESSLDIEITRKVETGDIVYIVSPPITGTID